MAFYDFLRYLAILLEISQVNQVTVKKCLSGTFLVVIYCNVTLFKPLRLKQR